MTCNLSKKGWNLVVGLEVHAQVLSHSKLFSGASTHFDAEANGNVSLVDAAFPGMLPVLNEYCVEQAVKTGLSLNAQINQMSMFDRKNYFYPDLPQGYQISQFYHPVVGEGYLDVSLAEGKTHRVRIERIHLEQDAGKSVHDLHPQKTCIDLNRCGIALMEIVTKPDMRSAEQAMAFVRDLRLLLRYLETSDGNMDEGSLRADVNISVHRSGEPFGTRVEVKNVNSIRYIGHAIEYESARQISLLSEGKEVVQETRLYDPTKQETRSMRSKENAVDYRYFPDPDLLPVILSPEYIDSLRKALPELPTEKKKRFVAQYGLTEYDAALLIEDVRVANYYEEAVTCTKGWKESQDVVSAKLVSNWLTGDMFAFMKKESKDISHTKITSQNLGSLVNLIQDGTISGRIAKDVILDMWSFSKAPEEIVKEKGLVQITDTGFLDKIISDVFKENPQMVADYRSGKEKVFGFLVGQAMKKSLGKGNPKLLNELLLKKLKN